MELELQQLDRRYESLRPVCSERDSRVLASLSRDGQQLAVVVVAGGDEGRFVLIDGYKRVRGLRKLGQDLVRATCWELPEQEALLLARLTRSGDGESALEQAWLLRELRDRFQFSLDELARRFGRSSSWVSRRLGLVKELPEAIQELVRKGLLAPHAAMKHLVPLARANQTGAIALAEAIAPLRPTTRQTHTLCCAFARGNKDARQQLLKHPELLLRATGAAPKPADPAQQLNQDLGALGGIARRALTHVRQGVVDGLLPPERTRLRNVTAGLRGDIDHLFNAIEKEIENVG